MWNRVPCAFTAGTPAEVSLGRGSANTGSVGLVAADRRTVGRSAPPPTPAGGLETGAGERNDVGGRRGDADRERGRLEPRRLRGEVQLDPAPIARGRTVEAQLPWCRRSRPGSRRRRHPSRRSTSPRAASCPCWSRTRSAATRAVERLAAEGQLGAIEVHGGRVAMPLSGTEATPAGASLDSASAAFLVPSDAGANTTAIVHEAAGGDGGRGVTRPAGTREVSGVRSGDRDRRPRQRGLAAVDHAHGHGRARRARRLSTERQRRLVERDDGTLPGTAQCHRVGAVEGVAPRWRAPRSGPRALSGRRPPSRCTSSRRDRRRGVARAAGNPGRTREPSASAPVIEIPTATGSRRHRWSRHRHRRARRAGRPAPKASDGWSRATVGNR